MMLFICSHEQMAWCECHVNNVLQSVIWGTVVRTARMTHGRRLKVSYDLPGITPRPSNLLRLEDTLCCILKYSVTVSTWPEINGENITTQQLTFITLPWLMSYLPLISPWGPIWHPFLLLTNFISSGKTTVDKLNFFVLKISLSFFLYSRSQKRKIARCLDRLRPCGDKGGMVEGAVLQNLTDWQIVKHCHPVANWIHNEGFLWHAALRLDKLLWGKK